MKVEHFLSGVAGQFDLGQIEDASEMRGSSNRLWKVRALAGDFVVKEFPYDTSDSVIHRREAAAFEAHLMVDGAVIAPEPIADRYGEYIAMVAGSRSASSVVRVHGWFEGNPTAVDDGGLVEQAGRSLRAIQEAGRAWSVCPQDSLQWWEGDAFQTLERWWPTGDTDRIELDAARQTIAEALNLIQEGQSQLGDRVFTHCDHKPENCLAQGGKLAVLDWDECGYCHPRLEAVEAALRWSGGVDLDPSRFLMFFGGYNSTRSSIGQVRASDFAKWLAALVGWFTFQARRSLGDWPDARARERLSATRMAQDSLVDLRRSLESLAQWTRLL